MSFSYAILVIWALLEGINDFGWLVVDPKVRGLLLLAFVVIAALEAIGVIKKSLPLGRAE